MIAIDSVRIGSLRLHGDAEKVPLADASDLRALRASLAENGQQDPVDVTEDGVILDGRTRWTLLQELGATTIQVRVQHVPADQQTAYIVDRALSRRHLTMRQKQALNDLMRVQVIEVRQPSPTTLDRGRSEPIRVGLSQTQRAEKLGVTRETVTRWDAEAPLDVTEVTTRPAPTHALDGRGRPQPLHKPRPVPDVPLVPTVKDRAPRPEPLRKARPIPSWSRHVSIWLRNSARPEDRDFLRRLDREIHAALDRNGIDCEKRNQ